MTSNEQVPPPNVTATPGQDIVPVDDIGKHAVNVLG